MPDSLRSRARAPRRSPAPPLTAAASLGATASRGSQSYLVTAPTEDELWSFYDNQGEFAAFADWMARAESRVRLGAAEQLPGGDEPAPVTEGPAADLMAQFYGGVASQPAFMSAATYQLVVPGQGWLIPERFDESVPLVLAHWSVQSNHTFRETSARGPEVQTAPGRWRPLLPDALPVRIWWPDPRFPYLARSPARAALPILRRIDLIDKRIVAELLSRIVMNGMLFIPAEAQLPSSPAYADQADPFFAELIDIAGRNIQTPGSALAAIPMPVKFQGDLIEKIRHFKMADPFDEQLLVERRDELARLAQTLPLSTERQQGFADANHWNGFIVSADDIKISIAPVAELIANAVTIGWLQPMLAEAGLPLVGPNGGKLLAWPDFSELTAQPDLREAVRDAYDRGEANGAALRRESGLSEADKPTAEEQREMIWLKAARDGANPAAPTAIEKLTGEPVAQTPAAGASVGPAGVPPTASDVPAAGAQVPPDATPAPEAAAVASALADFDGWAESLYPNGANGRR